MDKQPPTPEGTQAFLPSQVPITPSADDPSRLHGTQGGQDTTHPVPGAPAGSVPTPSPDSVARISTLGDFRLLKKLGEGGMGSVYKAHQTSLDRDVAVKGVAKHLAAKPRFVEPLSPEARIMAKLDHPNPLRCLRIGAEHGYHY